MKNIKEIKNYINAIDNQKRRIIIYLCYNKYKTLSQLSRDLGSNIKVTFENVKKLEKAGFIKTKRAKKEIHMPLYIKSNYSLKELISDIKEMKEVMKNEQ